MPTEYGRRTTVSTHLREGRSTRQVIVSTHIHKTAVPQIAAEFRAEGDQEEEYLSSFQKKHDHF